MTATASITWKLTGKPAGGGACEHCGRALAHRYEVTSDAGQKMTVGRGCLKSVTGWTLTAAQAARELANQAKRARWDANWAAWAATHATEAAVILADIASYEATISPSLGAGVSHEIRSFVREDSPWRDETVARYMQQRRTYVWVR